MVLLLMDWADHIIEDGYLLSHEWPIYVFDALLMVVALGICTTWYVGDIVSKTFHSDGEDMYVMMADQSGRRG